MPKNNALAEGHGKRMAAIERVVAENQEILDILRSHFCRKASKMLICEGGLPADPTGSCFGAVRVGLPGETWPIHQSMPMLPLCQINCNELPCRPRMLKDISLICVFCVSSMHYWPTTVQNGDGWVLRAYRDVRDLVEIKETTGESMVKAREYDDVRRCSILWELLENDQPDWADGTTAEEEAGAMSCGKLGISFPPQIFDVRDGTSTSKNVEKDGIGDIAEEFVRQLGHIECSKVGGWPTCVQDQVRWMLKKERPGRKKWYILGPREHLVDFVKNPAKPEYVLQIASERQAGWMWGDCGIAVFGRAMAGDMSEWFAEWHCS